MDVEKDVARLIWETVLNDDVIKLEAWIKQRPDALYLINKHLHRNALEFALENRRIRMITCLLGHHDQPHYESLLTEAMNDSHEWVRNCAKLKLRSSLATAHQITKELTECWRTQ